MRTLALGRRDICLGRGDPLLCAVEILVHPAVTSRAREATTHRD